MKQHSSNGKYFFKWKSFSSWTYISNYFPNNVRKIISVRQSSEMKQFHIGFTRSVIRNTTLLVSDLKMSDGIVPSHILDNNCLLKF